MKYNNTFIKQSNDWLYAHIYEHIISNALFNYMYHLGYLRNIHYLSYSHTDDGILYVELSSNELDVTKLFNNFIANYEIENRLVENSVMQISAEYGRKVLHFKSALKEDLTQLHSAPWYTIEDDFITEPLIKWNMSHKRNNVAYGRKNSLERDRFEVVYEIEDCPFELETMAVYLLQTLGLITCDMLYEKIRFCYDEGDMWAEYQVRVGYLNRIVAPRTLNLSEERLGEVQQEALRQLSKPKNIQSFIRYVKNDYSSPAPFFSLKNLYKYSYQIMGTKRFDKLATAENVQKLLKMIKTDVVRVE